MSVMLFSLILSRREMKMSSGYNDAGCVSKSILERVENGEFVMIYTVNFEVGANHFHLS